MAKYVLEPVNIKKPPIRVKHSDLVRCSDSIFKSKCTACPKGVLLVRRNPETHRLEEVDYCVGCGQAFIYLDIARLRKKDGFH